MRVWSERSVAGTVARVLWKTHQMNEVLPHSVQGG